MKITYISHATLLIEIDDIKIVTDPWVTGSAYCNQWHLFPKPLNANLIEDADYVIYSHGHEDHLHAESLQTIQKNTTILYPYSWYTGTKYFFHTLGFKHVREVVNEHTINIGNNIKITYLSNNIDNVVIIENKDTILVNVNDALTLSSRQTIEHFVSKIKHKWKNIDYVFSSYGGASYFPNAVHFANKNDIEIAETRELFFLTNFCKIVSGLNPSYAIPFATDFILLDNNQRWINKTKFPRAEIKEFYHSFINGIASNTNVIEAYSTDYFLDKQFFKTSVYHQKNTENNLMNTIDLDYKTEIEAKRNINYLNTNELQSLFRKVAHHILAKQYIIPQAIRRNIKFAIKITDALNENIFIVDFRNNNTHFTQTNKPAAGLDLLIEIKSQTLNYTIDNEWGGDAIIIGYGAEVFIYNEDAVLYEYENYCVRLLSRYPNIKEYLKKSPLRVLQYLIADTTKRKNLINKALGNKYKMLEHADQILSQRNLWLNKGKCEVCKACNL